MDHLLEFCNTEHQTKIVELTCQGFTKRVIGDMLGISERRVFKEVGRITVTPEMFAQ